MVKVKVFVTIKERVLDPQGKAVLDSLHDLSFDEVQNVRIGKYLELTLEETDDIKARIDEMCKKLLVNTVIEDYRFEIEEVN